MAFFEFFFSGPGWGWKVLALICFTSLFTDMVSEIVKSVLDYKNEKFKIELNTHYMHLKQSDNNTDDGQPATIDDVRH